MITYMNIVILAVPTLFFIILKCRHQSQYLLILGRRVQRENHNLFLRNITLKIMYSQMKTDIIYDHRKIRKMLIWILYQRNIQSIHILQLGKNRENFMDLE